MSRATDRPLLSAQQGTAVLQRGSAILAIAAFCLSATALAADTTSRFGDSAISATAETSGAHLGRITFHSADGREIASLVDAFSVKLSNGKTIRASELALQPTPKLATPAGAHSAIRQLCFTLTGKQAGMAATWCLVQPADAHYLRQTLTLKAMQGDVPVTEVALLDFSSADAHVVGTVSGSPAVAGNVYYGFEHPLSRTSISGGAVHAAIARTLPLRAGTSVTYSSVIGVAEPGQMRRDFLAYIERERPRAYAPFLHYNSWYDLGYGERYGEAGAVDRIHAFGEQLVQQRRVQLDSFLFDDGWDDTHSFWQFNQGFPQGFSHTSAEAAKYKAGVGVWVSPWGGYDVQKKERIAFGKGAGYEIVDEGYALSGPKYFAAFEKRCLEMIGKYHVNQFKIDGTGNANHVFPGSLFDSDFEAALALITRMRKEEPKLFVNLSTGTFASPFWLRYADSTWRGGEDNGFDGVGTWRQKWITYRDGQTYKNIVQAGPLFPLNSLMLHGILYAREVEHLETDPGNDFPDEVWSYFGTGTQLQEMYITPSLLNKTNWDTLATAANWSRANQNILRDTHWIGGDPAKLAVYGWAGWTPAKSIVVLRNPSAQAQTFALEAGKALELPRGATGHFTGHVVAGLSLQPFDVTAGSAMTVSLKPFEVRVMELTPRK